MAKRYVCPICETGRLAPERMADDDIRKYCLDCSRDTGKLVLMSCPARERQRERTAERAREKARKEREGVARARYFLDDGTDTRDILKHVTHLGTWAQEGTRYKDMARLCQRTLVVSGRSDMDADEIALHWITTIADKVVFEGFPARARNRTNRDSLVRAAGAEYFGIDEHQLVDIYRATKRLLPDFRRDGYTIRETILQVVRAKRKEQNHEEN